MSQYAIQLIKSQANEIGLILGPSKARDIIADKYNDRDIVDDIDKIKALRENLVQELNHEANTFWSESQYITPAELGLEIKVILDQMREQVQNVA